MSNAKGLDVSHNNGVLDWTAIKAAGYDFCFLKATQGTTFVDPLLLHNYNESSNAGMIRGFYHFFDATQDGVAQAQFFMEQVHLCGGLKDTDIGYCLDFEYPPDSPNAFPGGMPNAINQAYNFMWEIQQTGNRNPVIYMDRDMATNQVDGNFGEYHLWLAAYTTAPPAIPPQWSNYAFWQYTDQGSINGVGGFDLDESVFDLPGLQAWCGRTIIKP